MRWLLLLVALTAATAVQAGRMYQWIDPDTGTPYLSGTPPAWYRAGAEGPRVVVYEQGRLVDDTRWAASAERSAALRAEALAAAEAAREEAAAREAQRRERLLAGDTTAPADGTQAPAAGTNDALTPEETARRDAEAREKLAEYLKAVLDSAVTRGLDDLVGSGARREAAGAAPPE